MKQKIIKLIKNHIIDDDIILQKPKKEEFGHFAVPIFKYAKELKKNPMEYAKELCEKFDCYEEFESVEAISGFVNFKLSDEIMDILSNQVFEHVFNPNEFLKEINRVTKMGGVFMTVPFVWDEHE